MTNETMTFHSQYTLYGSSSSTYENGLATASTHHSHSVSVDWSDVNGPHSNGALTTWE